MNERLKFQKLESLCQQPDLMLDIGANEGESITDFRQIWPQTYIVAFEPRPEAWPALDALVAKDLHSESRHYGLGKANQELEMFKLPRCPGSSSILEPSEHLRKTRTWATRDELIKVQVKRLDDECLPEFKNLFIKLDVQGYTDRIISGGSKTFKKAMAALIEVSLEPAYCEQAELGSLKKQLSSCGLTLHSIVRPVYNKIGELIWFDGLWIRD